MDQHRDTRYDGRPLLILLENYAMAAIGQLPADHETKVSAAVVKLMGGDAKDWKATITKASGLPQDFDERIRQLWQKQKPGVRPTDFVIAISDATFVPLIDPTWGHS